MLKFIEGPISPAETSKIVGAAQSVSAKVATAMTSAMEPGIWRRAAFADTTQAFCSSKDCINEKTPPNDGAVSVNQGRLLFQSGRPSAAPRTYERADRSDLPTATPQTAKVRSPNRSSFGRRPLDSAANN